MTPTEQEKQTVAHMIALHCRGKHGSAVLCDSCQELHTYAMARLDRCPWGPEKPTCAKCPIHCYRQDMRQRVRSVMRYAGPRMALRHPVQYLRHWAKELFAEAPSQRRRRGP